MLVGCLMVLLLKNIIYLVKLCFRKKYSVCGMLVNNYIYMFIVYKKKFCGVKFRDLLIL